MGSVGKSGVVTRPDEFRGLLGDRNQYTKEQMFDRLDSMMLGHLNVNPNYGSDEAYATNCAIVSTAVALQLDGYDVEAGPRDAKVWRGFDEVYDVDYTNTDNYILASYKGWRGTGKYKGMPNEATIKRNMHGMMQGDPSKIEKMPRGAKAASKAIESKVQSWGDGAYGVMNVKWKGRDSYHAVNLMNIGGTVMIYDGQNGRKYFDLNKYLSRTDAGRTAIVRLDNAPKVDDFNKDTLSKMFKIRQS